MRSIKTKLFSLAMAVSMVLALAGCAMSAPSTVGTSAILSDVDWRVCLSAAVLAGILSMLTSVAGLPEVTE